MDHNVRAEIAAGLRRRGIDVLTAEEDGSSRLSDRALLNRATKLRRVLVSMDGNTSPVMDEDLLTEATRCQRDGEAFSGVVYSRQLAITIGQAVKDLELMATALDAEDVRDRVQFFHL